ncbi:hypothetical protein [Escherichia coli]|uniref:hypothetical protein n=1 Tax=Escherichia coli TaxID=562 RepID=UPI0007A61AF8|nr:hypothetical protein [Escherichia coli]AOR18138.1 hypothetical protein BBP24_02235 [Escherichia coli]EEW6022435.1 hypothetical protein [Escherichia coli]EFO1207306.1 hypothetical protein [Escherichia coli]MCH6955179.1 hypothetical protein [Escherichia coli]MDD8793239.1 hypothetical protein [Escherichia coli]
MTSLKTSIKTITYLSDIGCLEIQGPVYIYPSLSLILRYIYCLVFQGASSVKKIKHGLLVNFGKNIARQVSSLCASAMRVYPNEKHKPSRQLFHCIN